MSAITTYYTHDELAAIKSQPIPRHIAIIPDGNRRWAKKHMSTSVDGHRKGGDRLIETVKAAKEIGVRVVTFYVFSTENWSRSEEEVAALMWLLETFLNDHREEMVKEGIHFHTIGELKPFPENIHIAVECTKKATADCDCVDLVFALNYGSRNEISRACQKIAQACVSGTIAVEDIVENLVSAHLDTSSWGDPDLFIRASGEWRLSNFLLWQLSYAELYITPVLWPDFTPQHLLEAVHSFQKRQRRLGG